MAKEYQTMIRKAATVRDCEKILQVLAADQDIKSDDYYKTYCALEDRAREIKKKRAAAVNTAQSMRELIRR